MRHILFVAFIAVGVAGCASTDAVIMRHPDGRTAQCGPYRTDLRVGPTQVALERGCIEDYQRQGFQRLPR